MSGPSTETSRTWSGNWANLPTAELAQGIHLRDVVEESVTGDDGRVDEIAALAGTGRYVGPTGRPRLLMSS